MQLELESPRWPALADQPAAGPVPAVGPRFWPRLAAALLVLEAVLVTVPVAVLSHHFHFPAVLREPAAVALPLFRASQGFIVPAYYVFVLSALLYVPLSYALRRALAPAAGPARPLGSRLLAGLGLATALLQSLGFSRWVFAVPLLSAQYAAPDGTDTTRRAVALLYDLLNRYAGLTVGEHLGFLAMAAWTGCLAGLVWQGRGRSRLATGLAAAGLGLALALALSVGEHFGGPNAPAFAQLNLVANTVWTGWVLGLAGWLLRRPAERLAPAPAQTPRQP
ncbi:DUF4386 family protein [Hymenobacter sp.]|uniref:DUF4386 family protein n=1 Tax=Hymenobacter sp. TaxID=1898978 RepID=UPI00286D0C23|nr:DUF4386 family protein [Hymenobacter sp.]